eukprot:4720282-Prymnesium_polylepis.1
MMDSTALIWPRMSSSKAPPKMLSTVLTWVPTCFRSSFLRSHTVLRGPILPDSATISRRSSGRFLGMQTTRAR